jgi:hypothetical protein
MILHELDPIELSTWNAEAIGYSKVASLITDTALGWIDGFAHNVVEGHHEHARTGLRTAAARLTEALKWLELAEAAFKEPPTPTSER